jgi:dTMP kinase
MLKGNFITLEGGEGAGKTTQAKRVAKSLESIGIATIVTREPGGSKGAELIRKLLVKGEAKRWDGLTETLLFMAARRDHLKNTIWPALAEGKWVICDRFFDSTLAYQGYGYGLDKAVLKQLYFFIAGDFKPNVTFVFDLPAKTGLERAGKRKSNETRYESMDLDFHKRLQRSYLEIARDRPNSCIIMNAEGTIDEVYNTLKYHLKQRFGVAL